VEWQKAPFCISTNKQKLQINIIHGFLKNAYWSPGIAREVVQRAIDNSLCFGVYKDKKQVGFARVVSDCTKFAYLADVFVLDDYRKQGLGKWLMDCILKHPELKTITRFMLATADAHGLYRQFGFTELSDPERLMERRISTPNDEKG